MGTVNGRGVIVVLSNNVDTKSVPEGFKSCSFVNTGEGDGTLTQNGQSWTLPAGAVFNLPSTRDNDYWFAVSIDATGTIIEAVYYR